MCDLSLLTDDEYRILCNSIPHSMVANYFQKNPKEFAKVLEENAQLNWNICTEADEMKTTIVDNYVFFVMSPTSFEE